MWFDFFLCAFFFFFFKQKTAYEMRISDWSSDVCSSDLVGVARQAAREAEAQYVEHRLALAGVAETLADFLLQAVAAVIGRVDDLLGPGAERFHHLAPARDAGPGGAAHGHQDAPPGCGKAPRDPAHPPTGAPRPWF